MKRFTCWTLLTAIAVSTGCSTFDKDWKKKLPWSAEARMKSSKFETPARMIAIWSSDVITQPGKPATRGFGGRIYFYNEKSQAVPVDGQLVVYGYDDTQDPHQPGQPQRKFAFTPDQFTQHFSSSDLGASYSIWIPWDAAGGEQCNISLVPIFTATSGQIVMGQQAINVLPGRKSLDGLPEQQPPQLSSQLQPGVESVAHRQSRNGISAASFANNDVAQQPAQSLRTSTIRLTPALQRRLAQSGAAPEVKPANEQERNTALQPVQQLPAYPTALPSIPVPSVASPAAPNRGPLPARFGRSKFPVRGGLGGQPTPLAPWTPPYPATPPSALQSASSPPPTSANQAAW